MTKFFKMDVMTQMESNSYTWTETSRKKLVALILLLLEQEKLVAAEEVYQVIEPQLTKNESRILEPCLPEFTGVVFGT